MNEEKILKMLPLSNISKKNLARAMCGLGYCFLENVHKNYYAACHGNFSELSMDLDWVDEPKDYYLFLGTSVAYDFDDVFLPDYYGLWVKKDYADKNFNMGWVEDYCRNFKDIAKPTISMPRKNGTGPSSRSTGPRDGRGGGRGNRSNTKTGTGRKTGGRKGTC